MTEEEPARTLYVQVDYKAADGTEHEAGSSVQYKVSDREALELLRRGVLSKTPVRRRGGE